MGCPSDDPAPARFPFAASALCIACVGAAAWLWMRYSYCWDIGARNLAGEAGVVTPGRWPDRAYVRFEAVVGEGSRSSGDPYGTEIEVLDPEAPSSALPVWIRGEYLLGERRRFVGRVRSSDYTIPDADGPGRERRTYVDTSASRFTGESVAGLVVGAMGVFVFAIALGQWLTERTRHRAAAVGTPP